MRFKSLLLALFCFYELAAYSQPADISGLISNFGKTYLADSNNMGIAIGVVSPQGIFKFTSGKKNLVSSDTITPQTLFEIGSITKTFTGLLYVLLVQEKLITPDDYIDKYLTSYVQLPEKSRNKIKLKYLVTHTSGLPRLPSDFFNKTDFQKSNPYVNYDASDLYNYLSKYIVHKVGKKAAYSNLGVGLLGHILALAAGKDYEQLVLYRICKPLKMPNTIFTLRNKADTLNMASGFNNGKTVFNWDFDIFAAAGALKSNLNDMLIYLAQNIQPSSSDSMKTAVLTSHMPLHRFAKRDNIAACWLIRKTGNNNSVVWHDGGTGGFRSFIAFNSQAKMGVVILSNSTNSVSNIGFEILKELSK